MHCCDCRGVTWPRNDPCNTECNMHCQCVKCSTQHGGQTHCQCVKCSTQHWVQYAVSVREMFHETRSAICIVRAWKFHATRSSSSRTDRWVHFQQTAGLRLFVHTWIVHGIVGCYQLTRTFGGFSAQCLSKPFLKEFTVLLLTTSLGRAFKVVVILIG